MARSRNSATLIMYFGGRFPSHGNSLSLTFLWPPLSSVEICLSNLLLWLFGATYFFLILALFGDHSFQLHLYFGPLYLQNWYCFENSNVDFLSGDFAFDIIPNTFSFTDLTLLAMMEYFQCYRVSFFPNKYENKNFLFF